jgi:hypothetical protein
VLNTTLAVLKCINACMLAQSQVLPTVCSVFVKERSQLVKVCV